MATLASASPVVPVGDERFFLRAAIVMAILVVAGFSFQLAMGRSSFSSPILVHLHAFTFMGWVFIYLLQNIFVAYGRMEFHRPLGWIAAAWIPLMLVMAYLVISVMVQRGTVPFFFKPQHFLIFDLMNVVTFASLSGAAIIMRRRTEWHRRLHFCGMSTLLMPAVGRLLPMPLLQPLAWEATFAVTLVFPAVGWWKDARRNGRAHPAWRWGIGVMLLGFILTEAITYSPVGSSIYNMVAEGSKGAQVAPLEFAAPPDGPRMTGR